MKINKIMMAAAGLLCLVGLSSCEYDNYEAPSRSFSGRLITSDGFSSTSRAMARLTPASVCAPTTTVHSLSCCLMPTMN